jgi:hypothetical protein
MKLSEIAFLQAVDERDIDFVLLEEFHSEPQFVRWFIETTTGSAAPDIHFIGAWHSISDPALGESDITVVYETGGVRCGILVENKIDAYAQPEQAGRYLSRGLTRQLTGEWNNYLTCIVAPEKYLGNDREATKYHAQISYETIREWIRKNTPGTSRQAFRLSLFDAAIEQNRRGRTKHFDERVAAFFRDYWELANAEFPELRMTRLDEAAANNTWIEFRPTNFRAKYRNTHFYHKIDSDVVDLEFRGLQSRCEELKALNQSLLVDGVSIAPRGRTTAALTIASPPMNARLPFTNQIAQAREALKAAYRLSILLPLVKLE